MCQNCMSATEAITINVAGLAAMATFTWDRARGVLNADWGRLRRIDRYDDAAELMSSMGLDPVEVLGQRPSGAQRVRVAVS